jgi:Pyruvate/2-oxoacid:ferredoxin oxidoreductase delta subunit
LIRDEIRAIAAIVEHEKRKIIICACVHGGDVSDSDMVTASMRAAAATGQEWRVVPDLCELAARKDASLAEYAKEPGSVILACHARAVKALFSAAGYRLPNEGVDIVNLRTTSADEVVRLLGVVNPVDLAQPHPELKSDGEWMPWFPIIDRARCHNCKQCLSFCLFGVYGLAENGRVEVMNPQQCKTHCPACARICPDVAIIFPKLAENPINGAPIQDEEAERARARANAHQMLGNNVYAALAERRKRTRKVPLFKPPPPAIGI